MPSLETKQTPQMRGSHSADTVSRRKQGSKMYLQNVTMYKQVHVVFTTSTEESEGEEQEFCPLTFTTPATQTFTAATADHKSSSHRAARVITLKSSRKPVSRLKSNYFFSFNISVLLLPCKCISKEPPTQVRK
jgi:hypothetical protein